MKRIHRTWQRRAWWLLAPAVAVVVAAALLLRTDVASNTEWPAWLAAPAPSVGS